jgi:hypothetical protein
VIYARVTEARDLLALALEELDRGSHFRAMHASSRAAYKVEKVWEVAR